MKTNVTMLSDLPDIDEIESPFPHERAIRTSQVKKLPYTGAMLLPEDQVDKHSKFVKNNHVAPSEAGMFSSRNDMFPRNDLFALDSDYPTNPNIPNLYSQQQGPPLVVQSEFNQFYQPPQIISCIDTAQHCTSCPVCSRLYNSDKTIYIVIIVILSMFCLILTKKVLDV